MRGLLAAALLLAAGAAAAQEQGPGGLLGRWPPAARGALDDSRIEAGLRQALEVAADTAIHLAGRHDGYQGNPAIRIPLPEPLKAVARGARAVGQGEEIDAFVLALNRAAEAAVPSAQPLLRAAIADLQLPEPRRLLDAGATAASDALRAQTDARLQEALQPSVGAALRDTGATEQYRELFGRLQALPFVRREPFDLERYVTERTLAGLFHLISDEERRIRLEPTARPSDLLRDVFGSRREDDR